MGEVSKDLVRTIDQAAMVAYAGATWDWNRMHYDSAYAAERKLPATVVDGQMLGALLAEHAMSLTDGDAFPTAMSFKYKSMVMAGETVRIEGDVEAQDGNISVVTQTGFVDDRVVIVGTTTLRPPT